ncbi:alcohol dehydrogenase catalytic domain-containing protein [Paenibacillus sp. LMG 31456]|uniref:Alcohol dehydrogenase catalytic domain-containing protein n=1 Tax=Paenibacillus foliorum TaxID=2654974 RepID=A0A972JZ00_9BACL|nr:alcohol dehydrogenase catalytic domain-containing protein [Paenibacillus foliorum]NOU92230.1 alcohol dehydrogenase catalytic domain-containing protein [Paenibacillus foliorum]
MKALVKTAQGPGHVELIDVLEPSCGDRDVKIEVKFTGICGTDLHVLHDTFKNYPPVILGHEFSGVIAETGAGVRDVSVGDRVAVNPSTAVTCGKCDYCRQGYYMFCSIRRGMGHGVNGAFTKYAVVRDDQVYKLPDDVSLEEAALAEPLACAVQAVEELTDIHLGDTVLLSGPGPIGTLCLLLLVAKGCKVIVAGTTQDRLRLDMAMQLGAALTVDVLQENLQEVIQRETDGRGVDVAMECAGVEASVAACLQAVKRRGRYVQVGILGKEIRLAFDTILYKQLQVVGSLAHSMQTWSRTLQLLRQRRLPLLQTVTHTIPLSQWRDGFDICEMKRGLKVLLTYDE